MTAPTPEQMRALAGHLEGIELALPAGTGVHVMVARDTLRAAADELDRLRADVALFRRIGGRLRAVIENAPHREHCRPHIACVCWKADAL